MITETHLREDERDARGYLVALTTGLVDEARRDLREAEARTVYERAELLVSDMASLKDLTFDGWHRMVRGYEALADTVASARNARARIARSYESMEEFWSDADAQAAGRSSYSYWDGHEHGRRRQLEAAIAARFGCESALL